MTERWVLDEIVDPAGARIIVERTESGGVARASFDLAGLPRVDSLMVGRPVAEVPTLVERLCGVCPTAHHLAGVQALESLYGVGQITPVANHLRRLLHHSSAVLTHAVREVSTDPDGALALRRFAKAVSVAAGSPGHFPTTAVVGGVRSSVSPADRDACLALADEALLAAERSATGLLSRVENALQGTSFDGADVALVDETGQPDLLGARLRAVSADGTTLIEAAAPAMWDDLVAEADPGAIAPHPYLVDLGPTDGLYRVGPVSQLRVGVLSTPRAAALQSRWLNHGGAAAARGVITLHSVEAMIDLLGREVAADLTVPVPELTDASIGVGWVDGPRGLLVHRYASDASGTMSATQILTPTAQNEPWLAQLLAASVGVEPAMEAAIREADPCLPVSSAPPGAMGLTIDERPARAKGD